MNKRLGISMAVLLSLATANMFSWGIGIQGGWNRDIPGQIAVTFALDNAPLVFATNFYIGDNIFAIGATGDYWFVNPTFGSSPLRWFIGAGAGAFVGFYPGNIAFSISGRVPLGLNIFLADKHVEPYIQVVPGIGLQFSPSFAAYFAFDAAVGVRFHFGKNRGRK